MTIYIMRLFLLILILVFNQSKESEKIVVIPRYFTIPVVTAEAYTPNDVSVGSQVKVKISQDVLWKNYLIFRKGTPVIAVVTEANKAGILGKSSLIVIDIRSTVATDGTIIPLKGSIKAEGKDRTMEAIGAAVGVCCLGLFIPGEQQSIGKGVGTIALTTQEVQIKCMVN